MVDPEDDLRIGVKSTAVLFGDDDRLITGLLQAVMLLSLYLVGQRFELGFGYAIALLGTALLFAYQQYLIRDRDRDQCFRAFLNNNWVGAALFLGIVLDTWGVARRGLPCRRPQRLPHRAGDTRCVQAEL